MIVYYKQAIWEGLGTHLFVKVPRPGDSEVTFSTEGTEDTSYSGPGLWGPGYGQTRALLLSACKTIETRANPQRRPFLKNTYSEWGPGDFSVAPGKILVRRPD